MKFTYLGTAAAEGFPAVFCNCKHCKEARRLGGKNIRTRSQSLINDDLLIDFPADTYGHFLANGIEGDKIKYLLVTHSHPDHLYPAELEMRMGCFAHDMRAAKLQIYCSEGAFGAIKNKALQNDGYELNLIKPFEKFAIEGYEIIPLPARHMEGDGAVFYVIKGDKTILYAHDTGYFFEEVFDFIKSEKLYFDFISLDCTNVDIPIPDSGTHMGLPNIDSLMKRLSELSAVDEKTVKYINHFSHNAEPLQHVLEEKVSKKGFKVSFDGESIEI